MIHLQYYCAILKGIKTIPNPTESLNQVSVFNEKLKILLNHIKVILNRILLNHYLYIHQLLRV